MMQYLQNRKALKCAPNIEFSFKSYSEFSIANLRYWWSISFIFMEIALRYFIIIIIYEFFHKLQTLPTIYLEFEFMWTKESRNKLHLSLLL